MWLFTKRGFVSIVVDRNDSKLMWMRARRKEDLEDLLTATLRPYWLQYITHSFVADYAYRVAIPARDVEKIVMELIREIDYDNFKSGCHLTRPDDHDYHRTLRTVWSVGKQLEV